MTKTAAHTYIAHIREYPPGLQYSRFYSSVNHSVDCRVYIAQASHAAGETDCRICNKRIRSDQGLGLQSVWTGP